MVLRNRRRQHKKTNKRWQRTKRTTKRTTKRRSLRKKHTRRRRGGGWPWTTRPKSKFRSPDGRSMVEHDQMPVLRKEEEEEAAAAAQQAQQAQQQQAEQQAQQAAERAAAAQQAEQQAQQQQATKELQKFMNPKVIAELSRLDPLAVNLANSAAWSLILKNVNVDSALQELQTAIATAEQEKVVEAAVIEKAKALVPVLELVALRRNYARQRTRNPYFQSDATTESHLNEMLIQSDIAQQQLKMAIEAQKDDDPNTEEANEANVKALEKVAAAATNQVNEARGALDEFEENNPRPRRRPGSDWSRRVEAANTTSAVLRGALPGREAVNAWSGSEYNARRWDL